MVKRHNLHTHTTYSDGILEPEKLIELTISKKLKILGISDHAFSRKLSEDHQITNRLEQYLEHLTRLKKASKGLDLKIGIEIDVSRHYGINPSELPFKILNRFDYILFEYIHTMFESWGEVGFRNISEIFSIRDKLKIPMGLAHYDLESHFGYNPESLERIEEMAKNNVFIEINQSEINQGRGRNTRNNVDYYELFSQELIARLKRYNVKFVIGTDSHNGSSLSDTEKARLFIKQHTFRYHSLVL